MKVWKMALEIQLLGSWRLIFTKHDQTAQIMYSSIKMESFRPECQTDGHFKVHDENDVCYCKGNDDDLHQLLFYAQVD